MKVRLKREMDVPSKFNSYYINASASLGDDRTGVIYARCYSPDFGEGVIIANAQCEIIVYGPMEMFEVIDEQIYGDWVEVDSLPNLTVRKIRCASFLANGNLLMRAFELDRDALAQFREHYAGLAGEAS